MIIADIFDNTNLRLTNEMAEVFVRAIKDIYPKSFAILKDSNYSDYEIAEHFLYEDLSLEEVKKIIKYIGRYGNMWIFS